VRAPGPAAHREPILRPPRGSKERCREGQALARAPHHITFSHAKGRTVLALSRFRLCKGQQVSQRLLAPSSVAEEGRLLPSDSRRLPREHMIWA